MRHSKDASTIYRSYRHGQGFDVPLLRLADFVESVNEEESTFEFSREVIEYLPKVISSGLRLTYLVFEERF